MLGSSTQCIINFVIISNLKINQLYKSRKFLVYVLNSYLCKQLCHATFCSMTHDEIKSKQAF